MGFQLSGIGDHLFCPPPWVPAAGSDDHRHGDDLGPPVSIVSFFQVHPQGRGSMVYCLAPTMGRKAKYPDVAFFLFPSYASACTLSSVCPDDGEYPARNKAN